MIWCTMNNNYLHWNNKIDINTVSLWGCSTGIVSNYGFLKGREQCLQSWLGSVVVSQLFAEGKQNIKHV